MTVKASLHKRFDDLLTKAMFADKTDKNVNTAILKQLRKLLKDLDNSKEWAYYNDSMAKLKKSIEDTISTINSRLKVTK